MRTRDMRNDHVTAPLNGKSPCNGGKVHGFSLSVSERDGHRVVRIGGELDIATRSRVRQACVGGFDNAVDVEMAEMTFMDCCGYGALVAARLQLQERGGSLTVLNQVGQPARLLTVLAALEAES